MQTNFLNEILGEENREQDFTENFLDASDFDFWAAKSNSRFLSSENLPDDEKLSKFFKLHIFHNKTLKGFFIIDILAFYYYYYMNLVLMENLLL